MKQFIREYFTFNKRERNGIFVLLSIIISVIVYLNLADKFIQRDKIDFTKFEKELQALNELPVETKEATNSRDTLKEESVSSLRFAFDPNGLPESDWKKLGLTYKQIRAIKNYESKGGTFRHKEDVKKMYVISAELYSSLEAYITILPKPKQSFSEYTSHQLPHTITLLELNSADSTQLTMIKGVGPFFAKNIIKYKKLLGGFCCKEQLMEVWKLDEEKYNQIEKYITVDASKITQININTCTARELKHPYISWKIANGMVNYREKHGNFNALEDLKKTDLLSDELILKLAPYLKMGN